MASDIRVVQEELGAFASKVQTESTTLSEEMISRQDGLMTGAVAVATSRLPNAQSLYGYHGGVLSQFGQYITDQNIGLLALSMGATSVQHNYTAADDESADGMRVVDLAFNPTDGTQSIQSMLQDVADGETPPAEVPSDVELLPEPTDLNPGSYEAPEASAGMPGAQDADGQAITHESGQADILHGVTSENGPEGPLDTTGLDSDNQQTYDEEYDRQIMLERLNGAGAGGVL